MHRDTFNLAELENVQAQTYYMPATLLQAYIVEGRNRFSFQIDNNNTFDASEYFNIEVVADSDNFLVRRGSDPEIEADELARWQVFNRNGSTVEPPVDHNGRPWFERDYALDTDADIDGDELINEFEMLVKAKPARRLTPMGTVCWISTKTTKAMASVTLRSRHAAVILV